MSAGISRRAFVAVFATGVAGLLSGCVNQHPLRGAGTGSGDGARIVVTSPATAEIFDRLELPLVGVPKTARGLPERYAQLPQVGTAMAPDLEAIKALDPDVVVSPNSLIADLRPKYAAAALACVFIDLKSIDGLYESVRYLGDKFSRSERAAELVADYEAYLADYRATTASGTADDPRVLVLMGVPGSYVVATPKSYVGSLVGLAGGSNVYAEATQDFVNANTEDMLARDPDIILRTAHALPDQVMQMFAEEFAENDIWRHFRAVGEGRVHDLDSSKFGMSAEFNYPEALEDLRPLLFS